MVEESKARSLEDVDGFDQVTGRILRLIEAGNEEQIAGEIEEYLVGHKGAGDELLLGGGVQVLERDFEGAVSSMGGANRILGETDRPALGSLYSQVYIKSQAMLPKRRRPAVIAGGEYYQRNLEALRECDRRLVEELESAEWPDEFMLLEYWGGHYFYYSSGQMLLLMNEQIKNDIDTRIQTRTPYAFGGIASGQEICYCLREQYQGIHGMRRIHYVFEKNVTRIKALLHLEDFSEALREHELVVFGGQGQGERVKELFSSLRYPPPDFAVKAGEELSGVLEEIKKVLDVTDLIEKANEYYQSEEFRERQKQIAAGELEPRILVYTCRWTTFLQYCARDYERAFKEIGCLARYLIEENDVQFISPMFLWREVEEFKPDVFFQVSHARATLDFLPREMPFICYMQDKCGPILDLEDMSGSVADHDLFVCMVKEFKRYLESKKVKSEQAVALPIPADEKMFYPVNSSGGEGEKYVVDIGFVNHGNIVPEKIFEQFLENYFGQEQDKKFKDKLTGVFTDLYDQTCREVDLCCFENEMQDLVLRQLGGDLDEQGRHDMSNLVTTFYITVYVLACRSRYLEALDEAGFDLAIYGNGWADHQRLQHRSRGPVAREGALNLVYNYSRINLSINPALTMHQRLSECGLAGGFMMVLDHPDDKDWMPVREYFEEGKEIVLFKDRKEMIEKCEYYLAHENERSEIARNMYERALRERTCRVGAEAILDYWRDLLSKTL
ncbi:MAG: glycosyltransferase family 1 protein [Planctomycetes bacterium]|nr:glycosyltransferase family 1 protein [Planctomycetota bacterium]